MEPERLYEVEVSTGDRGEPNRIAGVAGDLGSVEDDIDVHHPLIFSLPALPSCHAVGSGAGDRKSTRLNSSHASGSYGGICLNKQRDTRQRQDAVPST